MVYRLQTLQGDTEATTFNKPGIYVFLVLNIIGGLGMLVMLATAIISPKVHRLPTWYSFCVSWFLSAFAYTFLFITAEQFIQDPIYSICFIQSGLIYAMPPTTTGATLALLMQIHLSLPEPPSDRWKKISLATSCLLIMAPYTIMLVLFIGVSLYQTYIPSTLQVGQDGTYCHSKNTIWQKVTFSTVAVISLLIIIVQARLILKLYRNYWASRIRPQSFSTALRGFIFTLIGFIDLILAIALTIVSKDGLPFDILLSTLPVLAFLVFGTQKDMIMAWLFSKSRTPYKSENRGSIFFGRDVNP